MHSERWDLRRSVRDVPESGGRVGDAVVENAAENTAASLRASFACDSASVYRTSASPCLEAAESARARWYWEREEKYFDLTYRALVLVEKSCS